MNHAERRQNWDRTVKGLGPWFRWDRLHVEGTGMNLSVVLGVSVLAKKRLK